jgi:hypothetical protein
VENGPRRMPGRRRGHGTQGCFAVNRGACRNAAPPQRTQVQPGRCQETGMVQTQVTAHGWLGSTPEGRRRQIRGWRAGGSLAVASSTPATQLLSPAKIRELHHAKKHRQSRSGNETALGPPCRDCHPVLNP